MLWIVLALAAAPLQVARNVLQRGLVADAGPWGATLVRFLFGLPFSTAIFAVAALLTPDAAPDPSARFWSGAAAGAIPQVAASWRASLGAGVFGSAASACWFAALALAPAGPVRAVGLIEAPIAAAVGRLFRERPSLRQWLGGAVTVAGVALTALG